MKPSLTMPTAALGKTDASPHPIGKLLSKSGIRLDGSRPCDMRLKRPDALGRIAAYGSLGLGEAYMDGDWDCERLDEFFARVLRARLDRQVNPLRLLPAMLRARLFNRQSTRRAWHVGRFHYDLGNEFYQEMLGPCMVYSCGYWRESGTLAAAQEAKLELICRKLRLEPGHAEAPRVRPGAIAAIAATITEAARLTGRRCGFMDFVSG